jgi:aryl-alcohol dehydrogenase-like predicted oxidoreductase
MTHPDQNLLDKIAAEAEHAEATRDATLPYQRRQPTSAQAVYGLRLPIERIEQLRQIAQARGIDPSTLARNWIIEQLDRTQQRGDTDRDHWERDLRATTDRLRELLDERPTG